MHQLELLVGDPEPGVRLHVAGRKLHQGRGVLQLAFDTQVLILSAAAQREDRNVLPLPGSLRGGAAIKVVGALLSRGLIAESATDSQTKADSVLNRIWRNGEDGRAVLLSITDAGLAAIGIDHEGEAATATPAAHEVLGLPVPETEAQPGSPVDVAPQVAGTAQELVSRPENGSGHTTRPTRSPRTGTKQAMMIAMLGRPEGATVDEIVAATGWLPHTVRGAMAGALKKRLGLTITSEKVEGRGRVYRVDAQA